MRKMWKKTAVWLCTVFVLGALLAACGSDDGRTPSDGDTASRGEAGESGEGTAKPEPFQLKIMTNLHTPEVPHDEIEKLLEEKTNTQLDIQWVPDGSYEEKLNASFATGSLPQAVYMKNQATYIIFRDAIRNGQFWEIGPYLNEYPNLSRLDENVLKNTAVDGKIYGLYQERPLSRQGVIYRKDWADKLGIPEPETIDDLYNMMKKFTEEDPDGNNKRDTIGLTDRSDLIYGAFKTVASYFGTPNNWSLNGDRLEPEFMHPGYMETMKFFKRLYDEGLINKDFPVTSKDDQQNLIITGRAGVYIGSMPDVQSLHAKTAEIDPDAEYDVVNRIAGPDGAAGVWSIPGYGNIVLFPKSAVKSEEELKQILSFFDQLMSPELANLVKWGIEGKHYTLENGLVVKNSDTKMTDREQKPYEILQIGGESTIDMLKAYHPLPVKAKAEELVLDNNEILIHDPAAALDSVTMGEKGIELQQMITDATYNFILGQLDEAGFAKEIERWKKQGGEQMMTELAESYQQSPK